MAWMALLAAVAVLAFVARRHVAGLLCLREGLRRLARGDQNLPLMSGLPRSLEGAGNDLRTVASRLGDLGRTAREGSDFAAILGTIGEGVFIVDGSMRIRFSNRGTERLFDLSESPTGRTAMEAFRSIELQQLVQQGISSGRPQRGRCRRRGTPEDFRNECFSAGHGGRPDRRGGGGARSAGSRDWSVCAASLSPMFRMSCARL